MMDVSELVGRNIRFHRMRQGITQEWLAEKAEMSPANIRDLESKEYKLGPHIETLYKIAVALSVDVRRMFDARDMNGVRLASDDDLDWIRDLPVERVKVLRHVNEALDAEEIRKVLDEV